MFRLWLDTFYYKTVNRKRKTLVRYIPLTFNVFPKPHQTTLPSRTPPSVHQKHQPPQQVHLYLPVHLFMGSLLAQFSLSFLCSPLIRVGGNENSGTMSSRWRKLERTTGGGGRREDEGCATDYGDERRLRRDAVPTVGWQIDVVGVEGVVVEFLIKK